MVLLLEIFLLIVLGLFSVVFYLSRKNKEFYDKLPGPPPLPFIGNLLDFKNTTDILDVLLKYAQIYGGMYKVLGGPIEKAVVITDYKFLEGLLSSTRVLNKSDDYRFLHSWLGTGLLTSDGPKWKKHRRILTPAFHLQILEQFIEVFEAQGSVMVGKLEKEVGKDSVDIHPFVTLCMLDVICETAMGTKIAAQEQSDSDYVRSVKTMCKIIMERTCSLLQMWELTYPLSKNYNIEKEALKILHRQTNEVIGQRIRELENQVDGDKEKSKRKLAFLDLILQATVDGRHLTQEEIREEVDTFMFEGHDTTASAVSFALFCLANNPEVQNKVFEEQKALFGGDRNPSPTYADLQSMKYLEMVIKETLRLYPSVPMYGRKTNEPVEINGITVPKDVRLSIFPFALHRMAEYYPDPEKFDPGRFENVNGTKPFAYLPFSAGPRNCIGQKFAMLEMKSTISKVVRRFELGPAKPEHQLRLAFEIVLKSTTGVKISLKSRS